MYEFQIRTSDQNRTRIQMSKFVIWTSEYLTRILYMSEPIFEFSMSGLHFSNFWSRNSRILEHNFTNMWLSNAWIHIWMFKFFSNLNQSQVSNKLDPNYQTPTWLKFQFEHDRWMTLPRFLNRQIRMKELVEFLHVKTICIDNHASNITS